MNTLTMHNLILTLTIAIASFVPAVALASDLDVSFQAMPLFSEADVKPGDSVSRTFTVTNNGSEDEDVYVSVENISIPGTGSNLADVMMLTIENGSGTYYTGSFTDFFGDAPIMLSTLAPSADKTYTMTASLADTVGNPYQSTTFGFDLVVGFVGGDSTTDNGGGSNGGGSNGGGSTGGTSFSLFNEALVGTTTSAGTVSWNTNRPGTTYLVCGNLADGPYTLDEDDPQFGYPIAVGEFDNNTRDHVVEVTGLVPGTYECIPASRPGTTFNYTTGDPITFTLPPPGQIAGAATTVPTPSGFTPTAAPATPPPSVAGAATEGDDSIEGEAEAGAEPTVAGAVSDAVADVLEGDCTLTWLLLLLVFTLGWSLIDDLVRKTSGAWQKRLTQNLIFSAVYAVAVIAAGFLGVLATWWWVLALAWAMFTGFDYKKHQDDINWSANYRNAFYVALAVLFIVVHFVFGWPCVWIPFAVVGIAAAALYISRL